MNPLKDASNEDFVIEVTSIEDPFVADYPIDLDLVIYALIIKEQIDAKDFTKDPIKEGYPTEPTSFKVPDRVPCRRTV